VDFALSADQEEIRSLAARIFGDLATHDRLKELEDSGETLDRKLWGELASAGLLGLALPEDVGGAGLGFLETCVVLEEAGRAAACVFPLLATLVLGAAPIACFGSFEQKSRWLPRVSSGELLLSAALAGEQGVERREPPVLAVGLAGSGATTARDSGTGSSAGGGSGGRAWRLEGSKPYVPAGMVADAVLVPARMDEGGLALFFVEASAEGFFRSAQGTTSGHDEALVELRGCVVGEDGLLVEGPEAETALAWLVEHAMAAACVIQAGICQAALRLTASYTSERHQFGKPIATFQAVGQRAADAYVDTEAVRLTAWQAAWRLSEGLGASEEVAVAKFWADEGAQRVVHAAQHLHGGVGVDRDYPLHRYYLLTKHLAPTFGGATPSLLRLGAMMAARAKAAQAG